MALEMTHIAFYKCDMVYAAHFFITFFTIVQFSSRWILNLFPFYSVFRRKRFDPLDFRMVNLVAFIKSIPIWYYIKWQIFGTFITCTPSKSKIKTLSCKSNDSWIKKRWYKKNIGKIDSSFAFWDFEHSFYWLKLKPI